MERTVPVIPFNQPIGKFYMTKIKAEDLIEIVDVKPRHFDTYLNDSTGGPQRQQSVSRIDEISEFCADPDATFPTPIIISVYSGECNEKDFTYNTEQRLGHVLDGQHRVAGIKKYINQNKGTDTDFELPVVLMFGLEPNDEAYIFSIINSKQQKVTLSHVYDLYSNFDRKHPIITASRIAKALNRNEQSPYYRKIKMLGKKSNSFDKNADIYALCDIDDDYYIEETITQAAIVGGILNLIESPSNREKLAREANSASSIEIEFESKRPFRKYFFEGENGETIMYKILSNCFNALKTIFPREWANHNNFILSKAIGYDAVVMALPKIIEAGRLNKTLNQQFFENHFENCKRKLSGIELTSEHFNSTNQGKKKLAQYFMP